MTQSPTSELTVSSKPPFIKSPSDGLTSSTARYFIHFGLGLDLSDKIKNARASGSSTDDGLPVLSVKPEDSARARAKVARFADVTERLTRAGHDIHALNYDIDQVETTFSIVDLSGTSESELKKALTSTKDSARLYEVSKLIERSSKIRADITTLRNQLNQLPSKLAANETQGDASIVAEKNKQTLEAIRSPALKVHTSITKGLEARVHNELEKPINHIRSELRKINERVVRQADETKALAPDNLKRDINLLISSSIHKAEPSSSSRPE